MYSLRINLIPILIGSMFVIVECGNRTNHHWDVISLVQHWLPTNCKELRIQGLTRSCKKPTKAIGWALHGLWPSSFNSSFPQYCEHRAPFRIEDLAAIRGELDHAWPDIIDGSPTFWSHQWSKHGTCLDLPPWHHPTKYFQLAVELRMKYDVNTILHKAQIMPSDEITYKLEQFEKAIVRNTGNKPIIKCLKHEGKQFVREVAICLSKQLKTIDCKLNSRYSHYINNLSVNLKWISFIVIRDEFCRQRLV